jgi:hypothetical protein
MLRYLVPGFASGILMVGSTAALAQAQGPEIGSTDAGRAVSSTRDQQAAYNRLIGQLDHPELKTGLKGKQVPATLADLKVGSGLRDVAGVPIGTIAAVETDGAIVDTGQTKIKVPTVAFGKDDNGLLLGITAARFAELIAKARASN